MDPITVAVLASIPVFATFIVLVEDKRSQEIIKKK